MKRTVSYYEHPCISTWEHASDADQKLIETHTMVIAIPLSSYLIYRLREGGKIHGPDETQGALI